MRLDFTTSNVEKYLFGLLKGSVSANVFAGSLPSNLGNGWKDAVLIDCSLPLVDYNAFLSGTAYVYLLAKPNANGTKNIPTMSSLETSFLTTLKTNHDFHYRVQTYNTFAGFAEDIQWHFNCFELIVNVY